MSVSPGGSYEYNDKTARVWDLKGRSLATLQGHQEFVFSASFSPNGQHIVIKIYLATHPVMQVLQGTLS